MEPRITLKELAQSLNLSISTVSKSINDSPEISPETKNRVKELATLRHYIPNSMAQNLKLKKTKKIGVILPTIYPKFFAEALSAIEAQARERGYDIIICISNESTQAEMACVDKLILERIDGIIISISKESLFKKKFQHLKRVMNYKIPIVMFDRILEDISCDKIKLEESLLAEQAVLNLSKKGLKKIAYLSRSFYNLDSERKNGYLLGVKMIGSKKRIINFDESDFPHNKLKTLIENKKIDSLFAADELSAILAIKSLQDSGFKIPDDISVLAFTNGFLSEFINPSLSTIDHQGKEQGRLAVDTILDRIEGILFNEPLELTLRGDFLMRDSIRKS